MGALVLAAFVCLAYAATGCAALAVLRASMAPSVPPMLLKLGVFAVATLLCLAIGWPLWRGVRHDTPGEQPTLAAKPYVSAGLAGVLLAVALVTVPNLHVYPWAAPDEMHHLNVARNLAEHGRYASGLPEEGLRDFDSYDSVGAPVLAPIAVVFSGFGIGLTQARLVVVIYLFVFLCILYLLFCDHFGQVPALSAVLAAGLGHSSIYLGRTVYGEVPALAWFVIGLLCWRAAIRRGWHVWGLVAGLCFGLACLTKTILLLSAFCFLGALVYDVAGPRRLRLPHLVLPAIGTVLPLAAWSLLKTALGQTMATTTGDTIGVYQFYLLPGLHAALDNLAFAAKHPWMHVSFVFGIFAAVLVVFHRRYDPPLVVLFLVAALYAWWWLAFTPGTITRYLWFTQAIASAFAGALAGRLAVWAWQTPHGGKRALGAVAALAILAPWAPWVAQQAGEVYTNREMQPDHDLAALVEALPPDARVVTVEPPVRGTLLFLAPRPVELLAPGAPEAAEADVLITWDEGRIPPEARVADLRRVGRHVVVFLREPPQKRQ